VSNPEAREVNADATVEVVRRFADALSRVASMMAELHELATTRVGLVGELPDRVEISVGVDERPLYDLKLLPVPVCRVTDRTFNRVVVRGDRVILVADEHVRRFYSLSNTTVRGLLELWCNAGDVLEELTKTLAEAEGKLPNIIAKLRELLAYLELSK
jgi:hypothetical protein